MRFIFTLWLLALAMSSQAQTCTVSGTIQHVTSPISVDLIFMDNSNPNTVALTVTVLSDAVGNVQATVTNLPPNTMPIFSVRFASCIGAFQTVQGFIDPLLVVANFSGDFCPNTSTCQAFFSYTQTNASNPLEFEFTNTSLNFGDPTMTFTWTFDNATTVVNNNSAVSFTFPSAGTYNVCLTVSDGGNCSNTYCQTVSTTAQNNPCIGYFYANPTVGFSLNTTFNNFSSPFLFPNPNGTISNIATYSWDFGDGSTANNTQQYTTDHLYTIAGSYNVCLTVTDVNCSDVYCTPVEVGNAQIAGCAANFSWFQNDPYNNPEMVIFNNQSSNFDINTATFAWDFGDGSTSTDINPVYTYATTGTFTVSLTINYNGCTNTYTDVVNVVSSGSACLADFMVLPSPAGTPSQLINNSQGSNLSYFWDFGDGNTSTDPYPLHAYAASGTYNVCLTVSNTNAPNTPLVCTSTFCAPITFVLRNGSTPFLLEILPPSNRTEVGTQNLNATESIQWIIFPNPVSTNLLLKSNIAPTQDVQFSILNVMGQELSNRKMASSNTTYSIPVEQLANGTYFVRITSSKQMPQIYKFVKAD